MTKRCQWVPEKQWTLGQNTFKINTKGERGVKKLTGSMLKTKQEKEAQKWKIKITRTVIGTISVPGKSLNSTT